MMVVIISAASSFPAPHLPRGMGEGTWGDSQNSVLASCYTLALLFSDVPLVFALTFFHGIWSSMGLFVVRGLNWRLSGCDWVSDGFGTRSPYHGDAIGPALDFSRTPTS